MSHRKDRRPRLPKHYVTFLVETATGGILTTRDPETALKFFYRDPEHSRLRYQLDGKKAFHDSTVLQRGLTEFTFASRVARMRIYCLFQHHFRPSERTYSIALADVITDTQRKGGSLYPNEENRDLLKRLQAMHRRAQRIESELQARELELSFKDMLIRSRRSLITTPTQRRRDLEVASRASSAHTNLTPTLSLIKTTHA